MTTQEFVEKMVKDEGLCKKMSGCKKPEEAYELAKAAGVTDDFDVFTNIMKQFNEQISQELSDEELENAAGGNSNGVTEWAIDFAANLIVQVAVSAASAAF